MQPYDLGALFVEVGEGVLDGWAAASLPGPSAFPVSPDLAVDAILALLAWPVDDLPRESRPRVPCDCGNAPADLSLLAAEAIARPTAVAPLAVRGLCRRGCKPSSAHCASALAWSWLRVPAERFGVTRVE